MTARRCTECPRRAAAGQMTCSWACTVARRTRRRTVTGSAVHPIPWLGTAAARRKARETRLRNHWQAKADARDAARVGRAA